jgi:hypothetical protein
MTVVPPGKGRAEDLHGEEGLGTSGGLPLPAFVAMRNFGVPRAGLGLVDSDPPGGKSLIT